MVLLAAENVAPGGPSAPVWAFLTAITLGILTLIGQHLSIRAKLNEAKSEASKAAQSATKAQENTTSVSNGFASRVDGKLDAIITEQDRQGDALRKHLEWHLHSPERK